MSKTFSYTAGDPSPDVTWYRKEKKIISNESERIHVSYDKISGISVVTVTNANKGDSGDYTVRARNKHGSFTFTVVVAVGKPLLDREPDANQKVKERKTSVTIIGSESESEEVTRRSHTTKKVLTEEESMTTEYRDKVSKERYSRSESVESKTEKRFSAESSVDASVTGVTTTSDTAITQETLGSAVPDGTTKTAQEDDDLVTQVSWEDDWTIADGSFPPRFSRTPDPVYVEVGEDIVLTCTVKGGHYCICCTQLLYRSKT